MEGYERVQELLFGMPGEEKEVYGGFRIEVVDRNERLVEVYDARWREGFRGIGVGSEARTASESCALWKSMVRRRGSGGFF